MYTNPMNELKTDPYSTIAVDANPATRAVMTGTEVFAREVARRLPGLAPDLAWRFYSGRAAAGLGIDLTVIPFPRLWSQVRLPLELARTRPDLFVTLAHVVPEACRVPALQVIHDLAYERFPEAYRPGARAYLRHTTRRAARVCAVLVAISESTRRDLAELYEVDPERVEIANPGGGEGTPAPATAKDAERLAELGVRGRFALHIGRVEKRKNQAAALAAVERVPGLTLVSAGAEHDPDLAASLRRNHRALLLGWVSDDERDLLYRRAEALVFPSLYEGWGIPVLEAMRAGLPVVTVRGSSLPEVGGDAALYVDDPHDAEGLAVHLARLAADPALRSALVEAGRTRAATFTWERTAQSVLKAIRRRLRELAQQRLAQRR